MPRLPRFSLNKATFRKAPKIQGLRFQQSVPAWMLPEITVDMTPHSAVVSAFNAFPRTLQQNGMRQAVRSAMGPLRVEVRRNVRKATANSALTFRTLHDSIEYRVTQPTNGWSTKGIVGAKRGFSRVVIAYRKWGYSKRLKHGYWLKKPVVWKGRRTPSRYLHLFEKGFRHWSGKQVKGRLVLFGAIVQSRVKAQDRFNATLVRFVNREAIKIADRLRAVRPAPLRPGRAA
jgi:hypothetical protein